VVVVLSIIRYFRNTLGQRGLAVINMSNYTNVDRGFGSVVVGGEAS